MAQSEIREPQQARSIEKKKRIIEAGLKVFSEKGYFNTTTVEIAKVAGVSTGIVYGYFADKKDIFLQALHLYFENLNGSVAKRINLPFAGTPEEEIRKIVLFSIQSHTENKIAHEEMLAMSHLDEDVRALFLAAEQQLTDAVVEQVKRYLPQLPNPKERVHIAYNLIEDLCHESVYHKHASLDYETMLNTVVQILVHLFFPAP